MDQLFLLDDDGRSSTTAIANLKKSQGEHHIRFLRIVFNTYCSSTELTRFQKVGEGYNDTRAGRTDRMAQSDGTASNVHLVSIQTKNLFKEDVSISSSNVLLSLTCSLTRATTLKASFNSNKLISLMDKPAFSRAMGKALLGAIVKSIGAQAASA